MRLILTLGIAAIAGSVVAILVASDGIGKAVGDAIDDFADSIAQVDYSEPPFGLLPSSHLEGLTR